MNRREFRDDAPPWSFFLPVTLAVVIGSLIADAIRVATGTVFVRDTAVKTVPPAETRIKAPTAVAAAPAQDKTESEARLAAPPATEASENAGPPGLPGPISATRGGADSACINGSVADRRPNGWEQALENDAPVRCTATSP